MKKISEVGSAAELANLNVFVGCPSSTAKGLGFSAERVGEIELAVEEAVTNVCKYAGEGRPAGLKVSCFEDEATFAVEISDDGKAFDMTARADPDLTADVEDRPIGGLGIYLIKKVCDAVSYRREGERNILRLEFKKPAP
jgi:anti-sigma regulatory factor (Ser/Thr protein kinase)